MATNGADEAKRSDPRFARPDASMSLLTNVMEHSLDEGYAEAARRKGVYGSSRLPRSTQGWLVFGVGLALVALILSIGAGQAHENAPVAERQRQALIDRINQSTSGADSTQQQVLSLQAQLDALRASAVGSAENARLAQLQLVVGTTAVSGPGIEVQVDDAASAGTDLNNASPRAGSGFGNTGRVRDSDLQLVVNALWQSGAEAIAINGQRLTTLSAIRAAGDAILVNDRPLTLPYTLQAIGGSGLESAFQENAYGGLYLDQLGKSYQIRHQVSAKGNLDLLAATVGALQYAHPSPSVEGTKQP